MPEECKSTWDIIESYGPIYEEARLSMGEQITVLVVHTRYGYSCCWIDYCREKGTVYHLPELHNNLREMVWWDILDHSGK
jgi:hypothetical protein